MIQLYQEISKIKESLIEPMLSTHYPVDVYIRQGPCPHPTSLPTLQTMLSRGLITQNWLRKLRHKLEEHF